jgi:bifunctional non-homologous end joining protein LigD
VAQAKHDGERRLIERKDTSIQGINKKGLYVALSNIIANTALALNSSDFVTDGEDMGSVIVAFDLLRYDGNDIRHLPYIERYRLLQEMIALSNSDVIRVTETAFTSDEKKQLLKKLKEDNHEGIVFKRKDAPWSAGRPNSGGDQLKNKFYDECTVIVEKVNEGKRSVSFYAYDKGKKVSLGNVTIPPNKSIPQPGSIIEIKFLYAFKNGSLYQPIYLKERGDSDFTDCSITQLKYKTEEIAA